MHYERSCGAVVFTREHGQIQFLLVRNQDGVYGFPKGHMEGKETELETATREIREETGLTVRFLPGFRAEDTYPSPAKRGWMKKVTYFLAEFAEQTYRLQQEEISGGGLYALDAALGLLQHESSRRILREADAFLRKTVA